LPDPSCGPDPEPYAALRGGNWNNGSNAGLFALNLNNVPTNTNNNIGFRGAIPLTARARVITVAPPPINGTGFVSRRFGGKQKLCCGASKVT